MGEAQSQLLIYDTTNFQWSSPSDVSNFQEDHPGKRYGHSSVLVQMHPPKLFLYGGVVGGGTFEFDAPDGVDAAEHEVQSSSIIQRTLAPNIRKGKKSVTIEDTDDSVYFLTLNADRWLWSKPLIHGSKQSKPAPRTEHTCCKTGTNEVTVFGGWSNKPMNDMWMFNFVDMEWKVSVSSGIQPRPRYRHTSEVIGLKMYVLGGSDNIEDISESARYLGLHELSLETMQWSHPTISGTNPFPRSGHSSSVIGAKSVCIFGGKRNNQVNRVVMY